MKCFMTNRECDYPKETIRKAFMLSPFGFPFDDLYKHALKPALEGIKLPITRADKTLQLGYVMCQRICQHIQSSEYVFADLSSPNANVYYELGLAYSLGKKIIIVQNKKTSHPFQNLFGKKNARIPAIIPYQTLSELNNSELFRRAIEKPIQLDESISQKVNMAIFEEALDPVMLNVENGITPLAGLQEKSLKEAMKKAKIPPPWSNVTVSLKETDKALHMVKHIQKSKICIVDTTHYKGALNMFMYFFVGLAHGFQKEVIPVINAALNKDMPFDIHGLWQIFFTRSEDLVKWLSDVLPRAKASIESQERDYLYKQLWSPFMEARRTAHGDEKKSLHVMTCARNIHDPDRGNRTNLDKNDFTTVADLAFFIGETFENAKVQIEPPTSKRIIEELVNGKSAKENISRQAVDQIKKDILAQFRELKGNWLIVGAPDSSDYSELVLAFAHGIKPYNPQKPNAKDKTRLPFMFVKKRSKINPLNASSFYDSPNDGEKEMIRWMGDPYTCYTGEEGKSSKGTTYGVITLLHQPLNEVISDGSKKFMILSGFTGIATYAMLEILTSIKYKEQYKKLLERYNEIKAQEKNVNILVKAEYYQKKEPQGGGKNPGDTRKLIGLEFMDIQEICL